MSAPPRGVVDTLSHGCPQTCNDLVPSLKRRPSVCQAQVVTLRNIFFHPFISCFLPDFVPAAAGSLRTTLRSQYRIPPPKPHNATRPTGVVNVRAQRGRSLAHPETTVDTLDGLVAAAPVDEPGLRRGEKWRRARTQAFQRKKTVQVIRH